MSPSSPARIFSMSVCRAMLWRHWSPAAILMFRFFAASPACQDAAAAGRVGREALLHEHVHALLHRVLDLHGAAVGVGREHGHVARPQAVDRVAIRVEPGETAVGGDVDPIGELLLQHVVSALEHVGRSGRPSHGA